MVNTKRGNTQFVHIFLKLCLWKGGGSGVLTRVWCQVCWAIGERCGGGTAALTLIQSPNYVGYVGSYRGSVPLTNLEKYIPHLSLFVRETSRLYDQVVHFTLSGHENIGLEQIVKCFASSNFSCYSCPYIFIESPLVHIIPIVLVSSN